MSFLTSQDAPHSAPVLGDEPPEEEEIELEDGGLGTATGAAAFAPICPVCRANISY
jgi:hypothetical protein